MHVDSSHASIHKPGVHYTRSCSIANMKNHQVTRRSLSQPGADSRHLSDRQALHLQNLQGIGRRTWSRAQLVIEHHAPVMHLFTEVIIVNTGYGIGQGDEFQVMGRNDANAMPACESMDVGTAPNEALPIIRTAKNFVDQKAQRYGLLSLAGT